jgi:hypothetical protein
MPKLIVLTCLYNKNQKNARINRSSIFICKAAKTIWILSDQTGQVRLEQVTLPDLI